MCADFCRMLGDGHSRGGVDRTGANDHLDAGVNQAFNALHPLRVGQKWPVAHRTAIDDCGHARRNQLFALPDQGIEVGGAVRFAGRQQRWNDTRKDFGLQRNLLFKRRMLEIFQHEIEVWIRRFVQHSSL